VSLRNKHIISIIVALVLFKLQVLTQLLFYTMYSTSVYLAQYPHLCGATFCAEEVRKLYIDMYRYRYRCRYRYRHISIFI